MHSSLCEPLKRGWPAQRLRREAERDTRRQAVDFDCWAGRFRLGHGGTAEAIGVAPGTLAFWKYRWRKDGLVADPLGRPCRRSLVAMRNAAINLMDSEGPWIGLPALQHAFPQMARGELANLQVRFRRIWRLDNRYFGHVLHWHQPGTVWAMDHVDPPQPIDGLWLHLLAVRDLASGCQLLWLPVADETARSTIAALESLFRQHGPPLVLKCDNGSGFIAEDTRDFLARWRAWPLFSPPYLPSYNGGCEAGNGAQQVRTHHQAALAGRPGCWTAADAEAARRQANEGHYGGGRDRPTPDERWQVRSPITEDDRAAFGRTVWHERKVACNERHYLFDAGLGFAAQAAIDRVAIRRALVEHGILTFTRRLITPPIRPQKRLNIS
jgi:hypothetical protein